MGKRVFPLIYYDFVLRHNILYFDGFEDKTQIQDIFIKDCVFDGVGESTINRIIGADNIRFENVRVNGKMYK